MSPSLPRKNAKSTQSPHNEEATMNSDRIEQYDEEQHGLLLSIEEVRLRFGPPKGVAPLSRSYLAQLRSLGGGPPFVKVGRKVFYPQYTADEWERRRKRLRWITPMQPMDAATAQPIPIRPNMRLLAGAALKAALPPSSTEEPEPAA
jgi:hypothetical protein